MGTQASKYSPHSTTSPPGQKTGKDIVLEKIRRNSAYEEIHDDVSTMLKFAECLSEEKELKASYLNPDWSITQLIHSKIEERQSNHQTNAKPNTSATNNLSLNRSRASVTSNSMNSTNENSLTAVIKKEDGQVEEEEAVNWNDLVLNHPDFHLTQSIPIKLLITDIHEQSKVKQTLRNIVSPVLTQFHVIPQYGIFHVALLIGAWKIEWNDSSLCVPRKTVARAALFAADIEKIETVGQLQNVVDQLAQVIVKWNTTMQYSDTAASPNTLIANGLQKGNCQDFVNDVLQQLGITLKIEPESALGKYLKSMKTKGQCKMVFKPDSAFREKFQLSQSKYKFVTHEQLDQFVENLVKLDVDFAQNHSEDFILLKSFDRAFWLRYLKYTEDENYKPLRAIEMDVEKRDAQGNIVKEKILQCSCPFGDPRKTLSLV